MADWTDAVVRLLTERGSTLKRYAFLLCGDRTEADDLVQDAVIRAFARLGATASSLDAEAYVRRCILNAVIDRRRRSIRWQRIKPLVASRSDSPDIADAVGRKIDVQAALEALSPRQRACVVLRHYEDQSVGAIATQLQCGEGTVKRTLSDARHKLMPYLEAAGREQLR